MKKILTAILIVVLTATALLTASDLNESDLTESGRTYTVQAANTYSATIGYPGIDNYSFCYHTSPGQPEDMCVGMGIMAYYDTSHGDSSPYRYVSAQWSFFSAIGWDGSKSPYLNYYPLIDNIQNCYCWWKIDGIWHEHYFDADVAPYWQGSGINQYVMDPLYPTANPYSFNPDYATTICGKVGQYFQYYWPPYPPVAYYMDVQVQPWYIVTASSGPPTTTTGPIYP